MTKLGRNPILKKIKETISKETLENFKLTPLDILQDLRKTRERFNLESKSLLEIFEDEKEYYIQFGMSAYDAGYLGKTLKKDA